MKGLLRVQALTLGLLLLASHTASAGIYSLFFDANGFSSPLNPYPPIVGTGDLAFAGSLGDGTYTLASLSSFTLSVAFTNGSAFTQADILSDLTHPELGSTTTVRTLTSRTSFPPGRLTARSIWKTKAELFRSRRLSLEWATARRRTYRRRRRQLWQFVFWQFGFAGSRTLFADVGRHRRVDFRGGRRDHPRTSQGEGPGRRLK